MSCIRRNVGIQPIEGRTDQHGVVDRRADLDALLGPQTAGEAKHLGAVGLHRKIAQGTIVGDCRHLHPPAEDGMQAAREHGVINCRVGPAPEHAIGFAVQAQQLTGADRRLADALGQRIGAHAVLDGQHRRFELISHRLVRGLSRVSWRGAGLLGESQVRVAGAIGIHHQRIAGQRRRDPKFLLCQSM